MFKAVIDTNTYISILEPRHADELFSLIDGSRDSIGKWLAFPEFTNEVQDTKTFIEKSLNRFANNNGFWAGIWHKEKIAGSIGYLYLDWGNNKTEIGYWLGKEFEGLGLATKACDLLIGHAFRELNLNKVEINVATQNFKSKVIPERLGFTKEGTIRNYEFLNGEYLDRIIYGLLKEEWLGKQ
ncbi:GNAT family N-acetyltransferase [Bacillus solitudinis]|uniref:GNAT family N-acetyltransferase n=1 Tax=Bacillus solitudinis TaxID=2014074 RepID=UPI000C243DA8|nr:GNAT family protein [Bacillus solitudinis]